MRTKRGGPILLVLALCASPDDLQARPTDARTCALEGGRVLHRYVSGGSALGYACAVAWVNYTHCEKALRGQTYGGGYFEGVPEKEVYCVIGSWKGPEGPTVTLGGTSSAQGSPPREAAAPRSGGSLARPENAAIKQAAGIGMSLAGAGLVIAGGFFAATAFWPCVAVGVVGLAMVYAGSHLIGSPLRMFDMIPSVPFF
jgi:hypothetical protein